MFEFLKRLFSREGAATPKAPERAPPPRPAATAPAPAAGQRLSDADRGEIVQQIRLLAAAGFDTREEIREAAEYFVASPAELPAPDRAWIAEEVGRAVADKRAMESGWPAATDFDRLDAVFDTLNDRGVIALHRAGTTQHEGQEEIAEAWRARSDPGRVVGYVFYHGQDVERVIETGELWLSYGAVEGSPETPQGVAAIVVAALARVGFNVAAPPNVDTRICIKGLAWRKRSPF